MAVVEASKPVKKSSTTTKKSKASPSHPPYINMITGALVSLKERTGSSHYAIAKHIEEQQNVRDLPANFKKLLFIQLKRFVASGKLVKVKNSFKLPSVAAKKSSAESKPKAEKESVKPKAAAKKVSVNKVKSPVKAKKLKSIKSPAKKAAVAKKAKK